MSDKGHKESPSPTRRESPVHKPATSLGQAAVIVVVSLVLCFGALEGGLALIGVKPVLESEDPFVGFAGDVPLFVEARGADGSTILTTARGKRHLFNRQVFDRTKTPGTYRIFSLGGSTTYGRPYDDTTSFSGWLRELLPVADGSKRWEVINAGGISYASYRVARLMKELVTYQPDLFIIYTGHNEFLEERTYRKLRSIPPVIQATASVLAQTRTWSAMSTLLQNLDLASQDEEVERDILAEEVAPILARSIGPESYTRNDRLRDEILDHYRNSLERMVTLARSAGARVIFVTPGANLKDSSPFKSEHTDGLDAAVRQSARELLDQAKTAVRREQWSGALDLLKDGVALDPRHAEMQYLRGKALLALGRFAEAEVAFRLARDEDVCPLRALTPMGPILTEVARSHRVKLVDYAGLVAQRMEDKHGHAISGNELFLDHVHPTIEGQRILALALIESMAQEGIIHPDSNWGDQAVEMVAANIESKIDQEDHGQALAHLAQVLLWAGKEEDSAQLARQALDMAPGSHDVVKTASTVLAMYNQRLGNLARTRQHLYSAIESDPDAADLHRKLGSLLHKRPFLQVDEAAANLLWAASQRPDDDVAQKLFGQAMVWRGRPKIAFASLTEALRLNPKSESARKTLDQIRPLLEKQQASQGPAGIQIETYASRAPRKLTQMGKDARGRAVADGIEVLFHENGRVMRVTDFVEGKQQGLDMSWDAGGKVLSRVVVRAGKPVDLEAARRQLYAALAQDPTALEPRLQLGAILLNRPFLELDEAAANLLWASHQHPTSSQAHHLFGKAMASRGRVEIAYSSFAQALRLNPNNEDARRTLTQIRPFLKEDPAKMPSPGILLESYPSGAPQRLVQVGLDSSSQTVRHGIEAEFHENGRVRRLVDFDQAVQDGLEMAWDEEGRAQSIVVYLQGNPVGN